MTDSTHIFESHRNHILGIAYRMLGDMSSAEDVAQETWLRWRKADHSGIGNVRAWLSTVAIRLSLDALRAQKARRESYVGPWLPEPLVPEDTRSLRSDRPDAHVELASDLSLALMLVLERLSPEERAALILHDAFERDYAEIAATLDKSEAACRKLVSRARERVRTERPRNTVSPEQHRALLQRFVAASTSQDTAQLVALFAPDITYRSDGGGRVLAALNPVTGADNVARLIAGLVGQLAQDGTEHVDTIDINGEPGLVVFGQGKILMTVSLQSDGDRITDLFVMRNPEKLTRFAAGMTG